MIEHQRGTDEEVIRRLNMRIKECDDQLKAMRQAANFFANHLMNNIPWDEDCNRMVAIMNTSMRPDGME